MESGDSGDSFEPPYFVPCKSALSESQKRIVEERVRAIRSEIPICVAVMKNNNVGFAQRWMLVRKLSISISHRVIEPILYACCCC